MEACIVIFYVVLPHSYLMNTAHNKDRIIDEGLKNIIKNAISMPFDVSSFFDSIRLVMNELFCENNSEVLEIAIQNGQQQKNVLDTCKSDTDNVYSIPSRKEGSTIAKNTEVSTHGVDSELPSSSQGVLVEKYSGPKALSDSEDDTTDDLTREQDILSIRRKILGHMIDSVNSEKHYLHYFLQMIDYEEQIKDKNQNCKNFVISTIKKSMEKEDKMDFIVRKKSKNSPNGKSKRSLEEQRSSYIPGTIVLSCDKIIERILIRKTIMEQFKQAISDDELFAQCLEELIDFEESLIEN